MKNKYERFNRYGNYFITFVYLNSFIIFCLLFIVVAIKNSEVLTVGEHVIILLILLLGIHITSKMFIDSLDKI